MTHRINGVVQDDIWSLPQHVPKGERSRANDSALRAQVRKCRRLDAATEMDLMLKDSGTPPVTTEEIVRWIREDRDHNH